MLIETDDKGFVLQARMVEVTSDTTAISALVGKQQDSDAVQLELGNSGMNVLINGIRVDFESIKEYHFDNVTVLQGSESDIKVIFSSGVVMNVIEQNGTLTVLRVSLSNDFLGATHGLMGTFNGNTSDDLVPKSSTQPIPLSSSLETIHNFFGLTCELAYVHK